MPVVLTGVERGLWPLTAFLNPFAPTRGFHIHFAVGQLLPVQPIPAKAADFISPWTQPELSGSVLLSSYSTENETTIPRNAAVSLLEASSATPRAKLHFCTTQLYKTRQTEARISFEQQTERTMSLFILTEPQTGR